MKLSVFRVGAVALSLALGLGATIVAPQVANATPPLQCMTGDTVMTTMPNGSKICYRDYAPSDGQLINETFTVPANVGQLAVQLRGGHGIWRNYYLTGGDGADFQMSRYVNEGDSFTVTSGHGGYGGDTTSCIATGTVPYAGQGGDYAMIQMVGDPTVIGVAGGGGGPGCGDHLGSYGGNGANGGNASLPAVTTGPHPVAAVPAAAGGDWSASGSTGGGAATTSAGGSAGTGNLHNGAAGSYLSAGADSGVNTYPGGGGGGGYYGGGSGGSAGAGGGGGSSYVNGFNVNLAGPMSTGNKLAAWIRITYAVALPVPRPTGQPTAVAGDGSAVVTFASAGGGPAPTSYTVMSIPGSKTCTVSPTDNPLSCTVTGLTNGTQYRFVVTAYNANGSTGSQFSDPITPIAQQTLQPTPSITGVVRVGQTVSAGSLSFDAGSTQTYQWYRQGTPISGATSSTYTIGAGDYWYDLTVQVVSTKAGFADSTATSSPITVLSATPQIYGNLQVGQTLTADTGYWSSDNSLSYQWRANGVAIPGATSDTYTLTPSEFNKRITLAVTGTRPGRPGVTKIGARTAPVALGRLSNVPVPTISGSFLVGQTLTAVPGTWDDGVTLSYKWFRSGTQIPGETSSTYTLTQADSGKGIAVRVSGGKNGYVPEWRTCAYTQVTVLQRQVLTATPQIYGVYAYGQTLSVTIGSWDPGATVSWVWARNGIPVTGTENQTSYQLGSADLGKRITVRLTSTEPGYYDEKRVSNTTNLISLARFAFSDKPVVTGDAVAYGYLWVDPGYWDYDANFSIQWYSNNDPIDGATGYSYHIAPWYVGTHIWAKVTGYADGYISLVRGSNLTSIVKAQ